MRLRGMTVTIQEEVRGDACPPPCQGAGYLSGRDFLQLALQAGWQRAASYFAGVRGVFH